CSRSSSAASSAPTRRRGTLERAASSGRRRFFFIGRILLLIDAHLITGRNRSVASFPWLSATGRAGGFAPSGHARLPGCAATKRACALRRRRSSAAGGL